MLLMALVAFACGSIPFGVIIARANSRDILREGSGNPGATNVWRVLGARWGLLCFALDVLKGFAPTAAAGIMGGVWGRTANEIAPGTQAMWMTVVASAMLGHMFSPWIGFKGGKGVATVFGGMCAMWPVVTVPVLMAFACWLVVAALTRYVSLAPIVAAAALPIATWAWSASTAGGHDARAAWPVVVLNSLLAALVVWKHRSNIARLRAGTENRIGGRPASAP